jgi:hypothetical protein
VKLGLFKEKAIAARIDFDVTRILNSATLTSSNTLLQVI